MHSNYRRNALGEKKQSSHEGFFPWAPVGFGS
jgi:hypothetical protein